MASKSAGLWRPFTAVVRNSWAVLLSSRRATLSFTASSSVVFINGVRYWGDGDDYSEMLVDDGVAQGIAIDGLSKDDEVYVLASVTE